MAALSVALLSFTHDKIADRAGGSDDPPQERVTDQIIYGFFYFAAILALFPSALSWFTHGGMLAFLAKHSASERSQSDAASTLITGQKRRDYLIQAIDEMTSFDDTLFWVVWFLVPSAFSITLGITVLVWAEHGRIVSVMATVGILYCFVQVVRIVIELAKAWNGRDSSTNTTRTPSVP